MPANSSLSLLFALGLLLPPSPRSEARLAFSASFALSSSSFFDNSCAMNIHPNFASFSKTRCNPPTASSSAPAKSASVVVSLDAGILPSPPPTRTTLPFAKELTPPNAEFAASKAIVSSNVELSFVSEQFTSNSNVLQADTIASRAGP